MYSVLSFRNSAVVYKYVSCLCRGKTLCLSKSGAGAPAGMRKGLGINDGQAVKTMLLDFQKSIFTA